MAGRLQLSRRRGWRKPDDAIVVARPLRWGNPFRIGDEDPTAPGTRLGRADAVERYRGLLDGSPELRARAREQLAGHDLLCWCPLDLPCHAALLLEVANPIRPETMVAGL